MPGTSQSAELPADPERVFDLLVQPPLYERWLSLHESWPESPPDRLDAGGEFSQVVSFAGMTLEVGWTVGRLEPATALELNGSATMGLTADIRFGLRPAEAGTTLRLAARVRGRPVAGPAGALAKRGAERAITDSLAQLKGLLA